MEEEQLDQFLCDGDTLRSGAFISRGTGEQWWGEWNKQRWFWEGNAHNAFRRENVDTFG